MWAGGVESLKAFTCTRAYHVFRAVGDGSINALDCTLRLGRPAFSAGAQRVDLITALAAPENAEEASGTAVVVTHYTRCPFELGRWRSSPLLGNLPRAGRWLFRNGLRRERQMSNRPGHVHLTYRTSQETECGEPGLLYSALES